MTRHPDDGYGPFPTQPVPAEHGQERDPPLSEMNELLRRAYDAEKERDAAADRERALVEAGNNVISDLERQGSVTSAHYNALRAALDRIQEGK